MVAAGRGGAQRRMAGRKRRGPGGRGPGGGEGPLKRLRLAVADFVRATSESEGREGRGAVAGSRPGGRRSRKELRKEKRQLRKARRLQRAVGSGAADREGGGGVRKAARPSEAPATPAAATANPAAAKAARADLKAPAARAEAKTASASAISAKAKAKGAPGKPAAAAAAAAAAARKRALLAANEEEDREIRKLERCLGLNKRKKKGDGSAVPLSFARDGLDYILGALECGRGGGGLLSEPNMASISGQLEELYMAHSRKHMNDTLTDALMDACVTASAMPSRLMMEHVLLVSILHHTVGIEVGACFLEAVVKKFDDVYKDGGEGKELDNLFTMIAHLYNFHVVQSLLIFDILKKLVGTFTEKDIELILLMLKNVGFALRKDDALSLKQLITDAQAKASGAGSKFQDQNRVRFMLETMLALKNNDMRKIPGYDPEPVEKLRKLQRALVRNAGSGSETQLRISWDGILNAEQTGRWWIVGSAWSGTPMIDNSHQTQLQKPLAGTVSSKMLELAKKQRMNTDVRRNIFCTIMTSEDFLDAFEKLLKLGLKDQQEREIVHILMDCCLQEKTYNPFYAFLASKFCSYERRFQMTFQFGIWDKFRDLENLTATKFSNLAHLVAHLLKTKSLPLSILKVVEFSELDKPRVHFLRRVLTELLMETEEEDLGLIFSRVSENPKLGMLQEGLKLFISHFLLKHTQTLQSAEEASLLRERAGLASKSLQGKAILRM
ncbi:nucleolar protein with MIF4G domain 1 [Cricetulus griseus]